MPQKRTYRSARGQDITGLRFGRLVVIEKTEQRCASGRLWLLRCDCGNEVRVSKCQVDAGYYQSCGCLRREMSRKHGMCGTPEYQAWADMISRCHGPKNPRFKDYGGRGIGVCDRWRSSFEAFYAELGPKPPGALLDRIDNDKGYEPGNCRWVTSKESAQNRRTTRFLSFGGETLSVAAWADRLGINQSALRSRLRLGWTTEEALATKPKRGNRIASVRARKEGGR